MSARRLLFLFLLLPALLACPKPNHKRVFCGLASWYSRGKRTASGERFRPWKAMTCAHRTLPFGTLLKVTALEGPRKGRWVIVRVNDRGPAKRFRRRVVDLTPVAFRRLAPLSRGLVRVRCEVIRLPSRTKGGRKR